MRWNYDRAELIADGVVHGIGVFCGLVATTVLIVLAGVFASAYEIVSVSVYAAGLLAMLRDLEREGRIPRDAVESVTTTRLH